MISEVTSNKSERDTPAMVFWNDWSFFLVTEMRVPSTDLDLTLSDLSRATEEKRGWLSTRPTFWIPSLITWINKNQWSVSPFNPSVVSYIESETKIDMSFTIILAMFLKPSHLNIFQTEIQFYHSLGIQFCTFGKYLITRVQRS